jgi:transposase, IS5 family
MRFLGLDLADSVPDANTIWGFREALTRARIAGRPAIEVLFERFDGALSAAGFLAMSGQIVDASIVAAPKQRNTDDEKRDIKEGRIPPAWAQKPAKLCQKDRDARWTVKYTKAKPSVDGAPRVDLAVPAFGYKNHVGIDRRHRLIRRWTVSDAARYDGTLLPELIDRNIHRQRRVGRHRLSLSGQREVPRRAPPAFTDPSQETQEMLWGERRGRGTIVAANKTDGGAPCLR